MTKDIDLLIYQNKRKSISERTYLRAYGILQLLQIELSKNKGSLFCSSHVASPSTYNLY